MYLSPIGKMMELFQFAILITSHQNGYVSYISKRCFFLNRNRGNWGQEFVGLARFIFSEV